MSYEHFDRWRNEQLADRARPHRRHPVLQRTTPDRADGRLDRSTPRGDPADLGTDRVRRRLDRRVARAAAGARADQPADRHQRRERRQGRGSPARVPGRPRTSRAVRRRRLFDADRRTRPDARHVAGGRRRGGGLAHHRRRGDDQQVGSAPPAVEHAATHRVGAAPDRRQRHAVRVQALPARRRP